MIYDHVVEELSEDERVVLSQIGLFEVIESEAGIGSLESLRFVKEFSNQL